MKQLASRFIDPLSDFGFKHLFGNEPNKDILINFLNELFKGEKVITNLIYSPTEHSGDNKDLKKAVFDMLCTGENGEKFIIEMQRGEQQNFKDRAVFYTSRLINEQFNKGKEHSNYELNEVYLIAILEFNFDRRLPLRHLHNAAITNIDTGEIFYPKLSYKFLELANFVKTEEELETDLDRWFYLLKHMNQLEKIPAVLNKRIFQKVFKIAEISNLTKKEKAMYDSDIKAKWDYENVMAFAEKKAEKKGKQEVALKLKQLNFPIDKISEVTNLTVTEIETL
ncbi:Rpn family recombination-promoting nuclease/putative transposase [Pedobacter sp. L105]|uniref:Rpn family recombination-promoting nuclease/putative transposase n=1 Tax=Pedobacter sp. L105 TaxID=1641871 RepID=UPI00131DA678|nr:Rpn family recombination-promoting nuclease/putative transposase [Pedobacter sp. L105]